MQIAHDEPGTAIFELQVLHYGTSLVAVKLNGQEHLIGKTWNV